MGETVSDVTRISVTVVLLGTFIMSILSLVIVMNAIVNTQFDDYRYNVTVAETTALQQYSNKTSMGAPLLWRILETYGEYIVEITVKDTNGYSTVITRDNLIDECLNNFSNRYEVQTVFSNDMWLMYVRRLQ